MPPRTALTLVALLAGVLLLFAACKNPGPTVVAQPAALPPLGVIVPIQGEGGDHAPVGDGTAPPAFVTTCGICHTVEGTGAQSTIGPDLTHVATDAATRTGLSAEEYIRESISEPAAFLSPGYTPLMPAGLVNILGRDYEAVVDYLLTLE